mmetsp:Transcript_4424/g.7221  ORF Transcript_4424/g.7221 Transcript_4424/m.7221 type:complete len:80 (+) Transcript_4424:1587-1826(+)
MFMKWDSYDAIEKHRDLINLQNFFYKVQKILHTTGAFLRQFLVDDKGCVLIACWGVPTASYENIGGNPDYPPVVRIVRN